MLSPMDGMREFWCSLRGSVARRCLHLDLKWYRIYSKEQRVGQKISLDFPVVTFRVSGLEGCTSWRFYFSIFLAAFYTSWWSMRSLEL